MIHGGIGADNAIYEWDGSVWMHSLYEEEAVWRKCNPDSWCEIPAPRSKHAGVIWGEFDHVLTLENEFKNAKYFIIFGGEISGSVTPTNQMWSFCEYHKWPEKKSDYFRWVQVIQTGDIPPARSGHTMTFIPNPLDSKHPTVFLAGGKDASGNALDDCYMGYLSRDLEQNPDNPWGSQITVTCEWVEKESGPDRFGHRAVKVIPDFTMMFMFMI